MSLPLRTTLGLVRMYESVHLEKGQGSTSVPFLPARDRVADRMLFLRHLEGERFSTILVPLPVARQRLTRCNRYLPCRPCCLHPKNESAPPPPPSGPGAVPAYELDAHLTCKQGSPGSAPAHTCTPVLIESAPFVIGRSRKPCVRSQSGQRYPRASTTSRELTQATPQPNPARKKGQQSALVPLARRLSPRRCSDDLVPCPLRLS